MNATPIQSRSRRYDFGALTLEFESDDSDWMDQLETRYGRFASDRPAAFSISHRANRRSLPDGLPSPLAVLNETQQFQKTARGCSIQTPTASIEIDLQNQQAHLEAPSAMYALDHLLRQSLPVLWSDGLLFHGAALIGEKAFVACGPSGAGKSTLAQLVGEQAVSDELCGVMHRENGLELHSLPYWNARPASAPLDAVLVLSHAPEHRLTRLDASEAFRRLHGNILWPGEFADRLAQALDALALLVETAPVYEFAFALKKDAWDFLMGMESFE